MITTKEKLNISRKLLNLNLITFKECAELRIKDYKDIYDLLQYLEYELDLNVELLNIEQLLND
jgi:hypothetical protein